MTADTADPQMRDWSMRPRRTVKPIQTYWAEYVETDTWYQQKIIEDVPEDELMAALVDEDFHNDNIDDRDSSHSDISSEEDPDFFPVVVSEEDDECSEVSEGDSKGGEESIGSCTTDTDEYTDEYSDSGGESEAEESV